MTMPQPVTYEVTAVAPDVQFSPTGSQIPGKQLTISTSTGYTGTVFVPANVLQDLDRVTAIVEDEVRKVAAVQAVKGTIQAS